MRLNRITLLTAGMLFANAAIAMPVYEYTDNDPTGNHNVGYIESVYSSYDENNETLSWQTTLTENDNMLYNGFWLVLSDGPNPKRHVDEYAILYADAINNQLTAYVYSGKNSSNSWRSKPFIGSYSGVLDVTDNGNSRTIGFSNFDVSGINSFSNNSNWDGAFFGENVGIWFHPVILNGVEYDADTGELNAFNYTKQGWYDKAFKQASKVPEPGTMLLFSIALCGLIILSLKKAVIKSQNRIG